MRPTVALKKTSTGDYIALPIPHQHPNVWGLWGDATITRYLTFSGEDKRVFNFFCCRYGNLKYETTLLIRDSDEQRVQYTFKQGVMLLPFVRAASDHERAWFATQPPDIELYKYGILQVWPDEDTLVVELLYGFEVLTPTQQAANPLWRRVVRALRNLPTLEYCRTDYWRHFRRGVYAGRPRRCSLCGARTNLQLHHVDYSRKGCEFPEDVAILCETCHVLIERQRKGLPATLDAPQLAFRFDEFDPNGGNGSGTIH
jgi:hypothetical protein